MRYPELLHLNGGSKQHWLRVHRVEVLQFLSKNGQEATLEEFHMRSKTLKDLVESNHEVRPVTDTERLQHQQDIQSADIAELRQDVRMVRSYLTEFELHVAEILREQFLMPMVKMITDGKASAPKISGDDALNIDDLIAPTSQKVGNMTLKRRSLDIMTSKQRKLKGHNT